jgi:hypothetical protein
MKTRLPFRFVLGLAAGVLLAALVFHLPHAGAEEARKEAITQEELDKKLDEILVSQRDLLKRAEGILTQTQFLKASSGK